MTSRTIIKNQRDARIDAEGTPPAIFLNTGDIAVDTNDGGWVLDFEEQAKTRKYTPYSRITINNVSSSGLNIYINQNRAWQKVVRASEIVAIDDFKGIRGIRISKRDGAVTVAAGEVEVNVERSPMSDDEFRRRQMAEPAPLRMLKNKLGLGV